MRTDLKRLLIGGALALVFVAVNAVAAYGQTAQGSSIDPVDNCAHGVELFQGTLDAPPTAEKVFTVNHHAEVVDEATGAVEDKRDIDMIARLTPTLDPADPTKVTGLSISIETCIQRADDFCDFALVSLRANRLKPWVVKFCGFATTVP